MHRGEVHRVACIAEIARRSNGHAGQPGGKQLLGHRLARLLARCDDADRGRLSVGGLCAPRLDTGTFTVRGLPMCQNSQDSSRRRGRLRSSSSPPTCKHLRALAARFLLDPSYSRAVGNRRSENGFSVLSLDAEERQEAIHAPPHQDDSSCSCSRTRRRRRISLRRFLNCISLEPSWTGPRSYQSRRSTKVQRKSLLRPSVQFVSPGFQG